MVQWVRFYARECFAPLFSRVERLTDTDPVPPGYSPNDVGASSGCRALGDLVALRRHHRLAPALIGREHRPRAQLRLAAVADRQ
jgi:hypothetical protein